MEDESIIQELLCAMEQSLKKDEKSPNTIAKYEKDVGAYLDYIALQKPPDQPLDMDWIFNQDNLHGYRLHLEEAYVPTGANSRISAINYFLKSRSLDHLCIKSFRIQRQSFRPDQRELTKEEYFRLLKAAEEKHNIRMNLLMQTIAATGIRVSELRFITVEAVQNGQACIRLKGKIRTVLLPTLLCRKLQEYAVQHNITRGCIFITSGGNPMNRSNISRAMKGISRSAGVPAEKVFPHNLRHLFAITYYESQNDLCHLADILGHSNLDTTRIYTSVSYSMHRRQIEGLGLVK